MTHTNRLAHETSPYLLQHAHNPVEWFPWGAEALAVAQTEDRPIFLSIGYSACHWCHVMEKESFEDEQTAALMNARFVCIKVDREERPDLDAIYMDAVQAMTGSGGWPMSVFLTPEGQPFYGGTYFPPAPRYGMPSFQQILIAVSDAYANKRADIEGQAERLTAALARSGAIAASGDNLDTQILIEAVSKLQQYFDDQYGGFGSQPKFPQPMTLDFAMSQYARTGDPDILSMAETTLAKMAEGGIYDQLGGGFHRYSVDRIWLVPHFEKMLYDNAQLLRSNLNLWKISGRELFRRVVNETTDYVLREMTSPEGGFYSTQDADSEGEEGKFFVWTPTEIEAILGKEDAALFGQVYGVTARGNFEGHTILNIVRPLEQVAKSAGLTAGELEQRLLAMRQKLFVEREKRIKPARDEKILAEWNGLMIHALAEVGVALERTDALTAAQDAANFVLGKMSQADGKLYRSYKDGQAKLNAYLEDYAAFVRGLIALYESTFDLRWLAEASRLTRLFLEQFGDSDGGGLFQTGADHERLVVRRKDFIDNAIPSGNSLAAESLLRLAKLTGNDGYRHEASRIFAPMASAMAQQPTGFGRLLGALDDYLHPSQEVAVVGDPEDPATQALLGVVYRRYLPHTVVALKRPDEENPLPLLEGRGLVDGKPAAYVCENFACKLPVTDGEALGELLM
ncbi:MAG: thioredoxin domain-containing protein [Chloroflexi bacterium]|nr:MAG: thioredoxin domain-containing protein [Chloroflexota bacterium]